MRRAKLEKLKKHIMLDFLECEKKGLPCYLEKISQRLEIPIGNLIEAALELYGEKKIDFLGEKICRFHPGFHFPQELRIIIATLAEDCLDKPNKNFGEKFLIEMEQALTKSGIKKFEGTACWGKNWPVLEPYILKQLALIFVHLCQRRAGKSTKAKEEGE